MSDCCGNCDHDHEHGDRRMSTPVMFQLDALHEECKDVMTLSFKGKVPCLPGQFFMVWIPGVEQKPYSLSKHSEDGFAITAKKFGPFSTALAGLKKGDWVGFSGPYGNSFTITKNALFVGGGVGMASISTAIDCSPDPRIIIGATSKDSLVFAKRYPQATIVTDDGSAGEKGYVTGPLEEALKGRRKPVIVQSCGPEGMLVAVKALCKKYDVPCQLSLERYMSCGFGICGKCIMDDKMVCYDGPIFLGDDLDKNEDFGAFARKKTGKKVLLKEY